MSCGKTTFEGPVHSDEGFGIATGIVINPDGSFGPAANVPSSVNSFQVQFYWVNMNGTQGPDGMPPPGRFQPWGSNYNSFVGSEDRIGYVIPLACRLVAMSVDGGTDITAGTMTHTLHHNGTPDTTWKTTLDINNPLYHIISPEELAIAAGDRISIDMQTVSMTPVGQLNNGHAVNLVFEYDV